MLRISIGSKMKIKDIGTEIRKRRNYLRITQIDLAEITGIGRRSLQYIESGKMNPSIEQLEKILQALGLEIIIRTKINE
jgi:transcriptional regulator with XRE-family HTH domain